MDFSAFENPVKVKSFTVQESVQHGARGTYNATYFRSRTFPTVDSSNVDAVTLTALYQTTRKLRLGVKSSIAEYHNSAFKRGGSLIVDYKIFKNASINTEFGYNKIHKMWNVEDANMYFGRVVLSYRW